MSGYNEGGYGEEAYGGGDSKTIHGITFNTVLDAVDDLGMDPNGNTPIDTTYQNNMQDDTLIEFPPGDYLVENGHEQNDISNFGIRGTGASPGATTFVYEQSDAARLLDSAGGTAILAQNFTIDYSSNQDGCLGAFTVTASDDIWAEDIHCVGFNPNQSNGDETNFAIQVTDSDGEGHIRGCKRTGPTEFESHGSQDGTANESIIFSGRGHYGTLYIEDVEIWNSGTNAIYASRTHGSVQVIDSYFQNCNQSAMRVGGGPKTDRIINCEVLIDLSIMSDDNIKPDGEPEYLINPTGFLLEVNHVEQGPVEIEDCDVYVADAPDRSRVMYVDGNVGPLDFTNCRFRSDDIEWYNAYIREQPRWHTRPDDPKVTFTDCHASGEGEVRVLDNRENEWNGGCLSCPESGVNFTGSVDNSSCDQPVITGDPGGSKTYGSVKRTNNGVVQTKSGGVIDTQQ